MLLLLYHIWEKNTAPSSFITVSEHSVPSASLAKSEKQLSWGQVSGHVLLSRECFTVKVFLTHMETVWKCKSFELRH